MSGLIQDKNREGVYSIEYFDTGEWCVYFDDGNHIDRVVEGDDLDTFYKHLNVIIGFSNKLAVIPKENV
jgi:hypothetical protein